MKLSVHTSSLLNYLTEDQILDLVILFQSNRKMDASKELSAMVFPRARLTTLDAFHYLEEVSKDF